MGKSRSDSRFRPARGAAAAAVLAVAAVAAAGCASPSGKGSHSTGVHQQQTHRDGRAPSTKAPAGARRSASTIEDACAARLHDISGLLLEYYALNRQLPERLEELAALAESESEFVPACPVSGLPYVYLPGGLGAPGTGQRLIIYEQSPAHNGLRWVVVAAPADGDQPPSTRVIPFTEQRFRKYFGRGEVPAAAPQSPAPPQTAPAPAPAPAPPGPQ